MTESIGNTCRSNDDAYRAAARLGESVYGNDVWGQPSPITPIDTGVSDSSRIRPDRSDFGRHPINLDKLIQGEIIPRLLSVHTAPGLHLVEKSPPVELTLEEIQAFAPLSLTLEADELMDRVDAMLSRGVSVVSIFVDLLAPSARKLGQFWEEDSCTFVDVTMGLWRLQEVMREVAMCVPAVTRALCEPRSALFSPMPGEQHSFGALMVEEIFAQAGWASEALIEPRRKDLLQTVAERDFDLLGLTVSCDCSSGALSDLITSVRAVSKNPKIQILIGGRVTNANPGLADEAGADGTAPDARSALALAERKVPGARLLDLAVL